LLTGGIFAIGGVIGLVYTAIAVRYLFPANTGAKGDLQQVGPVANFKDNQPVLVEYKEATGIPTGVFVMNKGGSFVAFDFHCTHLQCPVAIATTDKGPYYQCPCHGSQFNLDGSVRQGPAPVPLLQRQVSVQNGQVVIGGPA
jgi:cytochrome b6-f complex iron-sulfur subunit